MDKETFIAEVGQQAYDFYGVYDGADLAHNLLEMGVLHLHMPVDLASQIIAQHVLQA